MLGKLTRDAIPFDQPIALAASLVVIVVLLAVALYTLWKGWWPYLWREWITSVDHKRLGIMYALLALVMLARGFIDALMMRSQQAIAVGRNPGYLPPEHYDQIFSAHGTIMIFFVAMPFVIGLMNFVVPLQLGVRDVAFPVLNSVSFWLTASGALLVNVSLFVGEFAKTGWLAYPPLSETAFSAGVGVDYYLWSLQISGVGTLLTGINFTTTILQLFVSIRIRNRNALRDRTGDPWGGRTLEWSIASPPPWNFSVLPNVEGADAYWHMKKIGRMTAHRPPDEPIHLPRNSAVGVAIAFFSSFGGFALVWHIWWLAIIGFIGVVVSSLVHGWIIDRELEVSTDEIAAFERADGSASS